MTGDHDFQPHYSVDNIAEYWVAGCSCGWDGSYTHAASKYAHDDWAWHVQQGSKGYVGSGLDYVPDKYKTRLVPT